MQGVVLSLDRALTNLLDNAVVVSGQGSRIEVVTGTDAEWAWMSVTDQGPGLPAEPEGGRIGLGLSIVEQIVEAHEGSLVSSPGPGGIGTTMTIRLPRPGLDHPAS